MIQRVQKASNLSVILFTIVIMAWMIKKSIPSANPRGMLDMSGDHTENQRPLNRVDNWEDRNVMEFNKKSCTWGGTTPHISVSEATQLESSPTLKDLGVLKDTKLNADEPCAFTAKNRNCTLGCIRALAEI